MWRRSDHVQLGLLGREIENRDLEPAVVDLDHSEGAHETPIPVGQCGAPGIDESRAIGESPNKWDVGMPGDGDVHPPPEVPLEQRGNFVFGSDLGVLKVVGKSDGDTLDLDDDDVRYTGVIGNAGGSKPWVITVPTADECGRNQVEAVDDFDDVEIAAVEDAVDPG
jgi:hypothetical protein